MAQQPDHRIASYSRFVYTGQLQNRLDAIRLASIVSSVAEIVNDAVATKNLVSVDARFLAALDQLDSAIAPVQHEIRECLSGDDRVRAFARVLWSSAGILSWRPAAAAAGHGADGGTAAADRYADAYSASSSVLNKMMTDMRAVSQFQRGNEPVHTSDGGIYYLIGLMAAKINMALLTVQPELEVGQAQPPRAPVPAELFRNCLAALGDDCGNRTIVALTKVLSSTLEVAVLEVEEELLEYAGSEQCLSSERERGVAHSWLLRTRAIKESFLGACWFATEEEQRLIRQMLAERAE